MDDFDVVVVGASLAGSAAATLLGRSGLRVALVEARRDRDAFKRPCTHFLQPSATPVLERLGVVEAIEDAGGVRNSLALWSRRGWIHPPRGRRTHGEAAHGYTLRREKLDPILRTHAAETGGVELVLGSTARDVSDERGSPVRVTVESGGQRRRLRARLLVAADGRNSVVGRAAKVRSRAFPNRRFLYYTYYVDVARAFGDTGQLWLREPDMGYAFPVDDGLTLLACSVTKDRLADFKRDLDASFTRFFDRLPGAPYFDPRNRASRFMGKLDMTNGWRPGAHGRIAFVGDAAITPDPSFAVGCGWALQSAEWLADAVAEPLLSGAGPEPGLRRYRRRHRRELVPTFLAMSSYSIARPMLPPERLLYRGAARDPVLAEAVHGFGSGTVRLGRLISPLTLGRAAWMSATRRPRRLRSA